MRAAVENAVPVRRQSRASAKGAAPPVAASTPAKDSTLAQIQKMEKARQDRRLKTERARVLRAAEEKRNIANGNPGDIDFQRLIVDFRAAKDGSSQPHCAGDVKICVALRKRPVSIKEVQRKDHDSVSVFNPKVTVHNCKLKVDGITKYLDSSDFQFDHSFGDEDTTEDVYAYTARPLVPFVLDRGRATVFAYGQTGSGKTYTMVGIQKQSADDLFALLDAQPEHAASLHVYVSFFEIYGGRCQDLLNSRHRLDVREDGQGDVHIAGLEEFQAASAAELEALIERGNRNRTTHATESNDTSSRSHAICQIMLKEARSGKLHGKLSLIDLAGSERGTDTKSHNRQVR
jgi:kinesin family member 2/24